MAHLLLREVASRRRNLRVRPPCFEKRPKGWSLMRFVVRGTFALRLALPLLQGCSASSDAADVSADSALAASHGKTIAPRPVRADRTGQRAADRQARRL